MCAVCPAPQPTACTYPPSKIPVYHQDDSEIEKPEHTHDVKSSQTVKPLQANGALGSSATHQVSKEHTHTQARQVSHGGRGYCTCVPSSPHHAPPFGWDLG